MGDEETRPLTRPPPGMWCRVKAVMRSPGGRCALGSAGAALLCMAVYLALQSTQAQLSGAGFFPPRKIVAGNSLYERLVAAGKKSPIIMAGVNDDLAKPAPVRSQQRPHAALAPARRGSAPARGGSAPARGSSAPARGSSAPARGNSAVGRSGSGRVRPSPLRPSPLRPSPLRVGASPPTRVSGVDLTSGRLPAVDASRMVVDTGVLPVQGMDVYYAASLPPQSGVDDITFLLLHGSKFNSDTWQEIGTLQTLAALGYNAVAIDLPGPGFSKSKTHGRLPSGLSEADFLDAVQYELGLGDQVILVSPSLSGQFSVPLLMRRSGWLAGYVPVAPVGTEKLTPGKARSVRVPTAIIYGSRDRGLGASSLKALSQIRTSTVGVIPDAGHAAYLDNPQLWHLMLHNFARNLDKLGRQN